MYVMYMDADVLQAAKACTILSTTYIKVDERHNVSYFLVHDATSNETEVYKRIEI